MSELKVGDVVRLKSGGPQMTVDTAQYADSISVVWFDDSGKQCKGIFKEPMLEKIDPGEMGTAFGVYRD